VSDVWDIGFDLNGPAESRVNPDDYTARVIDADVKKLFDSMRLVLLFELIECPEVGTVLRFIAELPTSASGKGRHKRIALKLDVGPHSRYARAWAVANGGPPARFDRMKIGVFRDGVFRVRVRDVATDRRQRKLARPYSIVDEILERLE
jgi:hypothetical protein